MHTAKAQHPSQDFPGHPLPLASSNSTRLLQCPPQLCPKHARDQNPEGIKKDNPEEPHLHISDLTTWKWGGGAGIWRLTVILFKACCYCCGDIPLGSYAAENFPLGDICCCSCE